MPAPFFQVDNLLSIIERLHAERDGVQTLVDLANGLSSALGGAYVAIARWHEHPLERGPQISTGHDSHFDEVYLAHYPDRIPWRAKVHELAGRFFDAREHFDEATVRSTSFYAEFMEPQGFAPLAVIGSHHDPNEDGPGSGWAVYGRRDFQPEETRFCRRLDPHLAQAARNAGDRLVVQHRLDQVRELLDGIPAGIVTLESNGAVGWINLVARRILAAEDGLSLRDGRLVAEDEGADAALRAAHRQLIEGEHTVRSLMAGQQTPALSIERPSGRRPLGLVFVGRQETPVMEDGEPIGVIALYDPEIQSAETLPQLRQLYGLTEAEAKLASAIAVGATPQEFAEKTGRSLETVRTQLKGAFRKLGVSRQSEMVRMLAPLVLASGSDEAPDSVEPD